MSRPRNKGRKRSSVTGTAEEARELESLILQAHLTGSDEAWQELTQRILRCLERERLRPLHQVLGSLVEQRHWGALGHTVIHISSGALLSLGLLEAFGEVHDPHEALPKGLHPRLAIALAAEEAAEAGDQADRLVEPRRALR